MENYDAMKLIQEVKQRPPLWTNEPMDRDEKLSLWKEIGAALFPDWDQFNKAEAYDRVIHIQRKWRSLRDAYNRELRSRRTGVRINKRVYRYFVPLSFLGGFEGTISDEEEDFANQSTTDCVGSSDPLQVKRKSVKREKRSQQPASSEASVSENQYEHPVFLNTESEPDSDKLFLLSFLPEMKQLPVDIKMWARAQIANVMQEAISSYYNGTKRRDIETNIKTRREDNDSSE